MIFVTVIAGLGHYDEDFLRDWVVSAEKEESREEGRMDREAGEVLPNVNPVRLDRADVAMVVKGDSFFTPEAVKGLRAIVKDLESLDQVADVVWMDEIPALNIFGLAQPLLPRDKAPAAVFATAEEKA
ncbi:MAG: RND transporter, partial [Verrucomicrobiota bacterium]